MQEDPGTGRADTSARTGGLATQLAALLADSPTTVAAAESLSGGAIACFLAAAPGASTWFRGAVVAYSPDVKRDVLGVPVGPVVTRQCAESMADGVARLLGADLAIAVTGVGGPDPEEGQPPGTVWFSICDRGVLRAECLHFPGDPEAVVAATTAHALELLLATARESLAGGTERVEEQALGGLRAPTRGQV